MTDSASLLQAYDDELRTDAEVRGADSVERHGPLLVARFAGGSGFVSGLARGRGRAARGSRRASHHR